MDRPYKCIVLDLDGTVWSGVLAEDGPDGIELGPTAGGEPFLRLQRVLSELGERGMLFAIASKNDYAEATATIDSLEHFLIRDYVVSVKIGWGLKSASLREIADELGVGLDSLVFMDDSPFERELIRRELPEVFTPELPSRPEDYAEFVKRLPELRLSTPTPEAAGRAASYRAGARRAELATAMGEVGINEQFHAVVTFAQAEVDDVARIAELSCRTNQFNMTASRFTDEQLHDMLLHPDQWSVRVVRLTDDLEDLGIIGAVVIQRGSDEWTITEFVLSCRALSRDVERAVLWSLATEGLGAGARYLRGLFIPTDRNAAIASGVYPSNHFVFLDSDRSCQQWVLNLRGDLPSKPEGLVLRTEASAR